MVIVGMSVVATVFVLCFNHHDPNSGDMPKWVSESGLFECALLLIYGCCVLVFSWPCALCPGAVGSAPVGSLVPAHEAAG